MKARSRFATWVIPDGTTGKAMVTLGVGTLLALSLVLWVVFGVYKGDRDKFLAAVHLGMTKAEVEAAVGEPDLRLVVGQELPAWGSTPSQRLAAEAWVYFVFPKSQHRVVLTFANDRLEDVDYSPN